MSKKSPWGRAGPPEVTLNNEQLERFKYVGATEMQFHPKNGRPSPPISVDLFFGLEELVAALRQNSIPIGGVFLVGGAASFVVHPEYTYNDLDIMFTLEPTRAWTKDQETDFFVEIRSIVYNWLRWLMTRSGLNANDVDLMNSFVAKQFRLFSTRDNTDSWSLFSFNNKKGMNLELKFVLRMKRDYQFASDSIKIDLLSFFNRKQDVPLTSSFGDVQKAVELLERRQIETKNPEEIVGGGLLKYCLLKYKGFGDAREDQALNDLIHAMSNGFSRLWKTEASYKKPEVISKFLDNHFQQEVPAQKTAFLQLVEQFAGQFELEEIRFQVEDHIQTLKQQFEDEEDRLL